MQSAAQHVGHQLAAEGEGIPSMRLEPEPADLILYVGVVFLDNVDRFDRTAEVRDLLRGQRKGHAELEEGSFLPKDLSRIAVADAGGDHADLAGAFFGAGKGRGFGNLGRSLNTLLESQTHAAGQSRNGEGFRDILLIGPHLDLGACTRFNDAFGVADPGGQPQQHRQIKLLGEGEGRLHHIEALLAVGGLEHRQPRRLGVVAVVLLVLRGMLARFVGGDDHHAAVHAHINAGEHWVRGDVQADVLHGGKRASAGKGRAIGRFIGDLFVGGPLAGDFRVG